MEPHSPLAHTNIDLPSEVSLALLSASTFDFAERLLSESGVADAVNADVTLLSSSTRLLATGNISAQQYVKQIVEQYGIGEPEARALAALFVSEILFPYKHLLDIPVEEFVRDWKGEKVQIKETVFDIPSIVKEICGNQEFEFEDPSLQERCAKLIESRVRDVRTPEQTRAQLEKPVEQGGLGVTGRRLSDMLQTIERSVLAYQGQVIAAQALEREQKPTRPDRETLAKKEEALLTKRYVELTGKVPGEHIVPAGPDVSRTSAAISVHHEQLTREGKIDAAKVKEAVQRSQETTVPARRAKSLASMQEVTFEKRLSGPIDELRSLTLTDFRRLSKDPFQAATKVKDKVDLMEEQGYDKKVEAIQAWRSSPLNQMYVKLTRDAVLTGTSVVEILAKKRAAGEETLSDEELKAVMKSNADLRF
ncbi:hypothetical protein HY733_02570 [Candidatus Uhrbacteria bacterium]|nr:hypothetical protein [Candidatus Uhrbacteria bacterium]